MSRLKYGFTTGSCAAAAAKAAVYMLLTGREKRDITIQTPKGILYHAEILDITRFPDKVSCGVRKDAGDDPDVTDGSVIYACASATERYGETAESAEKTARAYERAAGSGEAVQEADIRVEISGGEGVGKVTRPGLDQPVGNAAINRVPRRMIEEEVTEVCRILDFKGVIRVMISVPGGEALAEKTFNPRLGIQGGISILGTTGIVEPMSEQALLDTIRVELNQRRAMGETSVAVSPGNYGLEYMKRTFGYDLDRSVKCSNFIGDTIDMAAECGFEKLLLTGHIGKLVKVSGGMMNTHSKMGDCRMELLAGAALPSGVEPDCVRRILTCVVTDEALELLEESGKMQDAMKLLMEKICFHLQKRAAGRIRVECMMYSNKYGELASSGGAKALLEEIMGQQESIGPV